MGPCHLARINIYYLHLWWGEDQLQHLMLLMSRLVNHIASTWYKGEIHLHITLRRLNFGIYRSYIWTASWIMTRPVRTRPLLIPSTSRFWFQVSSTHKGVPVIAWSYGGTCNTTYISKERTVEHFHRRRHMSRRVVFLPCQTRHSAPSCILITKNNRIKCRANVFPIDNFMWEVKSHENAIRSVILKFTCETTICEIDTVSSLDCDPFEALHDN